MRKGKILFPGFFKCEKKVELSGRRESGAGERKVEEFKKKRKKNLIVIYNLSADGQPGLDTNLARSSREELE